VVDYTPRDKQYTPPNRKGGYAAFCGDCVGVAQVNFAPGANWFCAGVRQVAATLGAYLYCAGVVLVDYFLRFLWVLNTDSNKGRLASKSAPL
jgi:hypothetical protein